jgi:hypothetical protein
VAEIARAAGHEAALDGANLDVVSRGQVRPKR